MKNFLLFVLVLLVLASLAGCASLTFVPKDGVTVDQMFESQDFPKNSHFRVIQYHPGYLDVLFNNVAYKLIDEPGDNYTMMYWGYQGEYSALFLELPLLSKYVWDDAREFLNVDYLAFHNGRGGEEPIAIVLFPADQMPKIVDPHIWEGTLATIEVWRYPEGGRIVQNITTGEVAVGLTSSAVDNAKRIFFLFPGNGPIWGYIHISEEPTTSGRGYLHLTLTQLP